MNADIAIFAGGCFWGIQYYFDQVPGVLETTVGYTGGTVDNPTYEQVCGHVTGHAEATRIVFDSAEVTYETLLSHFFMIHDPTQLNRQGPDIGDNYRSAIFFTTDQQREAAEAYVRQLDSEGRYGAPIVTQIIEAGVFWPAEPYHQKYAARTGRGMCHVEYRPL